jgi:hypothetical protein
MAGVLCMLWTATEEQRQVLKQQIAQHTAGERVGLCYGFCKSVAKHAALPAQNIISAPDMRIAAISVLCIAQQLGMLSACFLPC